MQKQFDQEELNRPLAEDERTVQVADFIGLYRGWFKEEHLNSFYKWWDWNHENGRESVSRDTSEGANYLEKKDKSLGIDKYQWPELSLVSEFNDFFKYLNQVLMPEYCARVPHVDNPTAHEGKMQLTLPGEGYHLWHCEWNHNLPKRVLAYALFLNDVEEGGELEFLHQSIRIKPRKGDFVIWPAYFTHIHRGNPPISNDKWIVTGWYEDMQINNDITFNREEFDGIQDPV